MQYENFVEVHFLRNPSLYREGPELFLEISLPAMTIVCSPVMFGNSKEFSSCLISLLLHFIILFSV
jgi:hypothetical protein